MIEIELFFLQIAHWAILLNLLWVLWQKSGADQELQEDEIRGEVKANRKLETKDATEDLEKVENKSATKDEIETAATALMG